MKTKSALFLPVLGFLLIVALVLVGCKPSPVRESKPSEDWSRGLLLGNFANGSIGMAVAEDEQLVHLVWPSDLGEGTYLRYVQLDAQANVVNSQDLDFPGLLRAPRLAPEGTGKLHLLWGSRPPGGKVWTIWHTLLDEEGNSLNSPLQISLPGESVGNYTVSPDHQGGALVIWDSGSLGKLYLQHVNAAGTITGLPVIVAERGESPSIWVNPKGEVFLAWREEPGFVYASASLNALAPTETTSVVDVNLSTGQSLVGPYVGVAGDWVYLFWSMLNQSGLEAGTGYTAYVTFPANTPARQVPQRILMSPLEEQPYAAYQGSLALSQLAPPVEAWASSDFILNPTVMQGSPSGELAVALALNQAMRLDQHLQIAVAVFEGGEFVGYTLGSKTEGISDKPVLYLDSMANLHLAWREGSAGNGIFYATTQPEAIAALDRLNAGDVTNAIFQGGMEGLVGVTFLPIIGFGWLLPGMLVVGIVKLRWDQDDLTNWYFWIPLTIAIVMFYLVKLATLPTISTYVPFSAWLDIPGGYGEPLQIIMPLLIFGIAALVANRVRRRHSQSAAVFYITFGLVDAILTLSIYGVNLFGVY